MTFLNFRLLKRTILSPQTTIFAAMQFIRQVIPNLFTSVNLLAGVVGITLTFTYNLTEAAICIFIGATADFLDGFVARAVKGASEMGKQFDSLADLINFGVLPGLILYQLSSGVWGIYGESLLTNKHYLMPPVICFFLPLAAGVRLAIFNIDTKQKNVFYGLPSPASAILVASVPILIDWQLGLNAYSPLNIEDLRPIYHQFFSFEWTTAEVLFMPYFYPIIAMFLSVAMLIRIPLLSFKLHSFSFRKNLWVYLFVICALTILIISIFSDFNWYFIPCTWTLYVLFSVFSWITSPKLPQNI